MSTRRYPRSARVNEVLREALADALERMSDPRLELVTVTGVEVTPDLREAKVFYSALRHADDADGTLDALRAAAPALRASLGDEVRMKYLPHLRFVADPAIEAGQRVEEILAGLHESEGRDTGDLGERGDGEAGENP
ncbi:MAG: 30S ribosome-binding factor RbfA [Acidimicrobiia bacterium]|nr:30S ribosome-binding factor RbfA [Acidimicrobiia bacterium]